jgi:hypothetical protein
MGDGELPSGVYTSLKVPFVMLARIRFRVSIAGGVERGDGGGVHSGAACGGGCGGGGHALSSPGGAGCAYPLPSQSGTKGGGSLFLYYSDCSAWWRGGGE